MYTIPSTVMFLAGILSDCGIPHIIRNVHMHPICTTSTMNTSALGGYFVQLLVLWGHTFCPLSGDRRSSVSRRLKMYYFYGKINWGHIVCPLYGGSQYLGESVMGGSTVIITQSLL